jgi:sodium-dependent dicarboxylate transporter 2/3/5
LSKDPKGRDPGGRQSEKARVLLVDDEDRFRRSLAERLSLRGYRVKDVDSGEEAIRAVRRGHPDVVLLDLRMPGMGGEETLKEIKQIAPEVQVVILTGHGNIESATVTGRLDAHSYLEKPCETEELIDAIEAAHEAKGHAMAKQEIPVLRSKSVLGWLLGTHNFRPGIIILGAVLFTTMAVIPPPASLVDLLSFEKTGQTTDPIAGFSEYANMENGQTLAGHYGKASKREIKVKVADGTVANQPLPPEKAARSALVMIGVLMLAALYWATGAIPMGFTAFLVGVLMIVFNVFPPDLTAKSYAKDSVMFIIGVLALAVGIAKTGLDKRIAIVLLGTSRSLTAFLFLFCPLLAVAASFLSEHALVAFIAPILMVVYVKATRATGVAKDPALAVMLMLALNFAANQGGPGSPAAGGRNAMMIGILADYGVPPSFGEWVQYGLPFVPVMALVIATYFFLVVRRKVKVKNVDVAAIVKKESKRIGKMTRKEWMAAFILAVVVILWVTSSSTLGMGGPVLLGLVAMTVTHIITWKDINKISWDVVALYAGATAMGVGLASTGAALWIARGFVAILPESLSSGMGLAIAASALTGVLTNFMSDGATVSTVGPITVPMASVAGVHPWQIGLATAFSSSFANALVIGTPNNAIIFALAKDPHTGEQLVTLGDFLKHGVVVSILALLVLWGWCFMGYWQWIGF